MTVRPPRPGSTRANLLARRLTAGHAAEPDPDQQSVGDPKPVELRERVLAPALTRRAAGGDPVIVLVELSESVESHGPEIVAWRARSDDSD